MPLKPIVHLLPIGVLACALARCSFASDHIIVPAMIGGKEVRLAFDTGAGAPLVLTHRAVERLELEVIAPAHSASEPAPGEVALRWTSPVPFELFGRKGEARFGVVELPPGAFPDFDGLVGWPAVRSLPVMVRAGDNSVVLGRPLPPEVLAWTKFRVRSDFSMLVIEVPQPAEAEPLLVIVDTGNFSGVVLPPARWKRWRAARGGDAVALEAFFMPGNDGFAVSELIWADVLEIGGLELRGVPVSEGSVAERSLGGRDLGAVSLGIAALRRLDLAIDGKNHVAYMRARTDAPPEFAHNRVGAVFLPRDDASTELVAHVLPAGPAARAGVHDGDVLLQVGDMDVTTWRADSKTEWSEQFELPAGTKLQLTLRRGDEKFTAIVELRNLIGPFVAK